MKALSDVVDYVDFLLPADKSQFFVLSCGGTGALILHIHIQWKQAKES